MGGRGSKSSRNSFTRDGGGGAREASANPEPKAPLPDRDQASAEEVRTSMYDLGKDAEAAAMTANRTSSLSEAKREIGYAKEHIAEHAKLADDIKARFNPTKDYMNAIRSDMGRARRNLAQAEAKLAAGKYTKP